MAARLVLEPAWIATAAPTRPPPRQRHATQMRCHAAARRPAPLLHGGGADAMAQGRSCYARLAPLHGATDCPCRCGAAVENLTRGSSLAARRLGASPQPGTEHLIPTAKGHSLSRQARLGSPSAAIPSTRRGSSDLLAATPGPTRNEPPLDRLHLRTGFQRLGLWRGPGAEPLAFLVLTNQSNRPPVSSSPGTNTASGRLPHNSVAARPRPVAGSFQGGTESPLPRTGGSDGGN